MKKSLILASSFLFVSTFVTSQNALLSAENQQNDANTDQTLLEKTAEQVGKATETVKHHSKKAKKNIKESAKEANEKMKKNAHIAAEKTEEAAENASDKMHDMKEAVVKKAGDLKDAASEKIQELKDKMQDIKDAENQGEAEKKKEYATEA